MGGLLHMVQRRGDWAGPQPTDSPLLAVPNVTTHPSTASVPIIVLLYNSPLLCGINVPLKGQQALLGNVERVAEIIPQTLRERAYDYLRQHKHTSVTKLSV